MNTTYLNIEHTFYRTACYIHALDLSPSDLTSNHQLYNTLATAAYQFFETVALRSSANARVIALSGCDFYEICNDVTMHYLNKFHRLWESSSPDYYMASVMTQTNRKVLDLVRKNALDQTVSSEEIEFLLEDSFNLEASVQQSEEINDLVSLLANHINGMDAIYFLARFALDMKPKSIAEELSNHSSKEIAMAVLNTCARQTSINISLLEQIAVNVMRDKITLSTPDLSTLAAHISDRIYETKYYLKKAVQKSHTAHA